MNDEWIYLNSVSAEYLSKHSPYHGSFSNIWGSFEYKMITAAPTLYLYMQQI
jgi:hypothetical protein